MRPRKGGIWEVQKHDIEEAIKLLPTMSHVLRHFGVHTHGNRQALVKRLREENIDDSKFRRTRGAWNKGLKFQRVIDMEDALKRIFIESKDVASQTVRRHFLKIKEPVCECGQESTWLGKPLSLHLDHIDGNRHNHKLSNLRWLCPNCHSQTPTFAGKNNGTARETRTPTEHLQRVTC